MVERVSPVTKLDYNTEIEKSKRVQNSIEGSSLAKMPPHLTTFHPSKPALDIPVVGAMKNMIEYETITSRLGDHKQQSIKALFDHMDKLQRETSKQVEEAYQQSKDATFWGVLEDIGSMFMGAASTIFGFSLVSSGAGAAAGGALISSGVLSIANIALKHANVWDYFADQVAGKESTLHTAISKYTPTSLGLVAASLSLFGGYKGWSEAAKTGKDATMGLIQSTGTMLTSLMELPKGVASAALAKMKANINVTQTKSDLLSIDLQKIAEDVKDFYKRQLEVDELIASLAREASQAIQSVHQAV